MNVYIVHDGQYDQKHITGIYSTLGLAMDSLRHNPNRTWNTFNSDDWWLSNTDDYEIFKYELDKGHHD